MTTRKRKSKLDQLEVQDSVLALIKIATVWARRSFEDVGPLDRDADEELLGRVVELVGAHRNVPLVAASKGTKLALRESAIRMVECHGALVDVLKAVKKARNVRSQRAALSHQVAAILTRHGCACDLEQARTVVTTLQMGQSPSELAGKVMRRFGLWDYRSVAEARRELPALRAVAARRETTMLETIEYLMACLQVPIERLHEFAAALHAVRHGGELLARPSRPPTRRRSGTRPRLSDGKSTKSPIARTASSTTPPLRSAASLKYARYGTWRADAREVALLHGDYAFPDLDDTDSVPEDTDE